MRKSFTLLFAALLACVGVAKAQIASVDDLSNDKVYTLKSGRSNETTSHYLLYHTDAPNNLSSTYGSGHSMTYNDATNNFHFAIYKQEGKFYLFSVAAQKFVGKNDNNNGAIPLVEMPTNDLEIRTSNNATYNFVLSTNRSGALNAADTRDCHGLVNWSGGYNNLDDAGNIFQIAEVGNLDAQLKALIEEKINAGAVLAPAREAVASASDTRVGSYTTASVAALSSALDAYDASQTTENFNAVKTAYEALVAGGKKVELTAGEIFTVKCVEDIRGYMVYSTVEGMGSTTQAYLAGTYKPEDHAPIDAEGVYKEWAFIQHEGKNYIYNVENKKFITSDNVVKFSDTPYAFEFIALEGALWEVKFENNRFLSFSPGWGADCVRTEDGVDNGCKFYLDKTGVSVNNEVVSTVEAAFVQSWKDATLATIDYVGGYPSDYIGDIEAVSSLEDASDFDKFLAGERVALTAGEYYIKGANKAWYASNKGGEFIADDKSTELTTDHIWSFKATGDGGYKLKSVATGKYVSALVDAVATGSGATPVNEEADNAGTYTFTDNGAAKFIIKSGDKTMRTEGSGNINYWGSDVNEWYLVPVAKEPMTILGAKVGEVEIVDGAAEVTSITTIDLIFDRPVAEKERWGATIGQYEDAIGYEILEAEEGSDEYVVRFSVSQDWGGEYTDPGEYVLNIPAGLIVGADYSYLINPEFTATITIAGGSEEPGEPETPSASLNVTNVTVGEDVMEGLVAAATPTDMIVVNFDGKFYLQTVSIVDANGNNASEYFQYMNGLDTGNTAFNNSYIFMVADAPAGIYTITMAKASFADYEELGYKVPAEDIVLTVQILGEETKIDAVEADAKAVIYDLAGRRVEKMEKGIYIVNGKKVVIK